VLGLFHARLGETKEAEAIIAKLEELKSPLANDLRVAMKF